MLVFASSPKRQGQQRETCPIRPSTERINMVNCQTWTVNMYAFVANSSHHRTVDDVTDWTPRLMLWDHLSICHSGQTYLNTWESHHKHETSTELGLQYCDCTILSIVLYGYKKHTPSAILHIAFIYRWTQSGGLDMSKTSLTLILLHPTKPCLSVIIEHWGDHQTLDGVGHIHERERYGSSTATPLQKTASTVYADRKGCKAVFSNNLLMKSLKTRRNSCCVHLNVVTRHPLCNKYWREWRTNWFSYFGL